MVAATKKLNLMLHAGANAATREQVFAAPTPVETKTWQPVPHRELVEQFIDSAGRHGWKVTNEAHGLKPDGEQYFGMFQIEHAEHADGDYSLVAGVRNSHDQRFPAGICLGSGVFVCDNLAFSAEIAVMRRHTRWIQRDLPMMVERSIGQLCEARVDQTRRLDAYRDSAVTDTQAHDAICQAMIGRALPASKGALAVKEWHKPRHDAHAAYGKSGWRLFNAMTEAAKGNAGELTRRTQIIHGLVDTAVGLEAAMAS